MTPLRPPFCSPLECMTPVSKLWPNVALGLHSPWDAVVVVVGCCHSCCICCCSCSCCCCRGPVAVCEQKGGWDATMLWQQQRLHINYTLVWMRSLALMVHPAKALGSLADPDADADGDARQRLLLPLRRTRVCLPHLGPLQPWPQLNQIDNAFTRRRSPKGEWKAELQCPLTTQVDTTTHSHLLVCIEVHLMDTFGEKINWLFTILKCDRYYYY